MYVCVCGGGGRGGAGGGGYGMREIQYDFLLVLFNKYTFLWVL